MCLLYQTILKEGKSKRNKWEINKGKKSQKIMIDMGCYPISFCFCFCLTFLVLGSDVYKKCTFEFDNCLFSWTSNEYFCIEKASAYKFSFVYQCLIFFSQVKTFRQSLKIKPLIGKLVVLGQPVCTEACWLWF